MKYALKASEVIRHAGAI